MGKFPWICFLLYFSGAWVLTLPAGLHPASTLISTLFMGEGLPEGDQALFIYSLWWVRHALLELNTHPWFTPYLGAPEGISLLYTTLTPLLGLLSALPSYLIEPFLGPATWIFIYNVWILVSIALFPLFTSLVVMELKGSKTGALAAGLCVLYPNFIKSHFGHLNIISVYWIPLIYYFHLRFCNSRRTGWALGAAVAWGGVFYVSAYHLIHATILLALDAGRRLWLGRGDGLRRCNTILKTIFFTTFGVLTVLLSVFTLYTGWIMVFFLMTIFLVLAAGYAWNEENKPFRMKTFFALAVALVLVSPFFAVKDLDSRQKGVDVSTDLFSKINWSGQFLTYFLSERPARYLTDRGMLGGFENVTMFQTDGEYRIFPGYGVWSIVLFFLFFKKGKKRREDRYWLLWALVFAVLSFGPVLKWGEAVHVGWLPNEFIFLPGVVFDFFPVLDGYRVFARMGMVVLFCMAVFMGLRWGALEERVERWGGRFGKRGRTGLRWSAVVLAGCLILAERVEYPLPVQQARLPEFYSHLSRIPKQLTLCEFPTHEGVYLYPMTAHRHRLVNHYVSRLGEERKDKMMSNAFMWFLFQYGHPYPNLVELPAYEPTPERIRMDFDNLGVDGVVVHLSHVDLYDRNDIRHLFGEVLKLEEIHRDEKIVFFWNLRRGEIPDNFPRAKTPAPAHLVSVTK